MNSIKIEKGVPLPEAKGGRTLKYPWPSMKRGDSFSLRGGKKERIRVAVAACAWGKRNSATFATRQENGGFRIWRTK